MSKSKAKPAAKSKPAAPKSKPKSEVVEAVATVAQPTTTVDAPAPAAESSEAKTATKRFAKAVTTIEQNGIKRPAADSLCGRVWQALDDLRTAGADPTAKNAAAAFDGVAIAAATIRTQTQRWRKFNGL